MSTADSKQFGGDHYKGTGYEHWNLVADLGLDYYSACASKYVTRHRKKNGSVDIDKAIHFIEKKIELIETFKLPAPVYGAQPIRDVKEGMLGKFMVANGIYPMSFEGLVLFLVCLPAETNDLRNAVDTTRKIAVKYATGEYKNPPKPTAGGDTPSHVAAAMERQFGAEGWWGDGRVLWKCKKCGVYFHGKDGALPSTVHACATVAAEATPAYVNQDR